MILNRESFLIFIEGKYVILSAMHNENCFWEKFQDIELVHFFPKLSLCFSMH